MATDFKRSAIGLVGFCPELNQGLPSYSLEASGGTTTTITVAAGSSNAALYPEGGSAALWADLYNGLWVYFTSGANAGNAYKITDTAWSADVLTLTTTTLANAPSAGNTFFVMGTLAASGVSMTIGVENLTRDDLHRQTLDPASSLKGLQTATFSFDAEVIGLEQNHGVGQTPTRDRYSQLLRLIGARDVVEGTEVSGSGSSTTVVDVVSAAGFAAGDYIMVGGEVRKITATDTASTPDNVTVSPALSAAPENGTNVFGSEKFVPYDTGHPSGTFFVLVDDQWRQVNGAVITAGISATFGEKVVMSVEGTGEAFAVTDPQTIESIIPWSTNAPVKMLVGEFFHGTSEFGANTLAFTVGQGAELTRDTLENQIAFITSRSSTLQANLRNQSENLKTQTEANGTQANIIAVWSSSSSEPQNNTVAVAGNGQIQDPASYTSVNGIEYYDVTFGFVDDQDAISSTKPELLRF